MKKRFFTRTEQQDVYGLFRDPANKPFDRAGNPDRDSTSRKAFWLGYFNVNPKIGALTVSQHHEGSLEHAAFLAGWDGAEDEIGKNPGAPDMSSAQDFVKSFAKLGDEIKTLLNSPEAAFAAYHSGASIWQKLGGRWEEVNIAKDKRNNIHQPKRGRGRYLGQDVESSLVDPRK